MFELHRFIDNVKLNVSGVHPRDMCGLWLVIAPISGAGRFLHRGKVVIT